MLQAETTIKSFLLKTFDIRSGEFRRASLMQLNIFLLISTLLIVKPTVNSLFLSEAGIEKLPLAFILVAIGAGIITTVYSRVLIRVPLNRIIYYTLLISVTTILLLAALLRLNLMESWVLYAFYIWVAVFGVLSASQFWILANIVFNAREAKRLFGFIGSGAIAGGIFGGYLTSLMAPLIGSENLLFIAALFLLLCIPINKAIWRSNVTIRESPLRQKKRMGKLTEHPFRLIRKSKHLTYLALITAVGVLVARLVDFQFSALSVERIPDEDELTAFFGFWFSNFNILSLLIQLFLTRKVVGVFGVGIALFILPTGILIGALAVLIVPGLGSAIFVKASDGSLKQSVNKSAMELLALPIPTETKNQAKTFIDVFVDSFATGISGLILILLVNGFNLSVQFVSISVILLIGLWFYFSSKVRKEYIALFKLKLNPIKPEKEAEILDISNDSVYSGLERVLEQGTDEQILLVLGKIENIKHERLFPSLRKLLKHPSPEIVTKAIQKLYFYSDRSLNDEIKPFIKHSNQNIKVAAIEYLIEHSPGERIKLIHTFLNNKDYKVSGATLLSLINEIRDNELLKKTFNIEKLIKERLALIERVKDSEELLFRRINILKVIGLANIPRYYSIIRKSLADPDLRIVQQAIATTRTTLDPSIIPDLFPLLKRTETKEKAGLALAGFGDEILNYIELNISLPAYDPELMRNIPMILENIDAQRSVNLLFMLLEFDDNQVRHEALISLNKIKSHYPHLIIQNKRIINTILEEAQLYQNTLSALYIHQQSISADNSKNAEVNVTQKELIRLLEKRLDNNLERIFKLLGLKYPPDEIETVFQGITSEKPEMRINALEFLDNLLEANLKKVLMPLIETATLETITLETLNNLHIRISGQEECLMMLLEGKDSQLKLAVLRLIGNLEDPKYREVVRSLCQHPNQTIKATAQKVLSAWDKK